MELQNLTKEQMQALLKTDVSGAVALLEFLKEEQQEDSKSFSESNEEYY
jgi:hypothetical protein